MMTLTRADISPTLGIDSPSFDETIDDMSAVQRPFTMVCTDFDGATCFTRLRPCRDGTQVSAAILEEKDMAKLKKLTISELKPGMLLLTTDEGRKREKGAACMSPCCLRKTALSIKTALAMQYCCERQTMDCMSAISSSNLTRHPDMRGSLSAPIASCAT